MRWKEVKQLVSMTSSVESLCTTPEKLAEAGRPFMREQIKVCLISKVVSQSEFDVLEYPDEESITPKLKKVVFMQIAFGV